MELGRPPPVWHSAVAYGETQVLNSNSTSAVQDPQLLTKCEQLIFRFFFFFLTDVYVNIKGISASCTADRNPRKTDVIRTSDLTICKVR